MEKPPKESWDIKIVAKQRWKRAIVIKFPYLKLYKSKWKTKSEAEKKKLIHFVTSWNRFAWQKNDPNEIYQIKTLMGEKEVE